MTRFVEDWEGSLWNLDYVERFKIELCQVREVYEIKFLSNKEWHELSGFSFDDEDKAYYYLIDILKDTIIAGPEEREEK